MSARTNLCGGASPVLLQPMRDRLLEKPFISDTWEALEIALQEWIEEDQQSLGGGSDPVANHYVNGFRITVYNQPQKGVVKLEFDTDDDGSWVGGGFHVLDGSDLSLVDGRVVWVLANDERCGITALVKGRDVAAVLAGGL